MFSPFRCQMFHFIANLPKRCSYGMVRIPEIVIQVFLTTGTVFAYPFPAGQNGQTVQIAGHFVPRNGMSLGFDNGFIQQGRSGIEIEDRLFAFGSNNMTLRQIPHSPLPMDIDAVERTVQRQFRLGFIDHRFQINIPPHTVHKVRIDFKPSQRVRHHQAGIPLRRKGLDELQPFDSIPAADTVRQNLTFGRQRDEGHQKGRYDLLDSHCLNTLKDSVWHPRRPIPSTASIRPMNSVFTSEAAKGISTTPFSSVSTAGCHCNRIR